MSVLVNPENDEVHEFSPEESKKLIQQGWLVPLMNKEGIAEAIPYEQGQQYLQNGYALPNDAQLNDLLNRTKYSTGEQKTKAFAEGVAKGLTGPAYSIIAPKTGLTTREEIKNREEYNPGLSTTGEIAGTIGGALTGTGLPGLIGKAGTAAGVAGKVLGKAGELAASGATEGALYSAADQINEKILGDPKALSESLMAHVGFSALLGGAAGLAFSPLAKTVNNAGKLTQEAAEKMSGEHIVGKALDKVFDTATDLTLPGIARPAAKLAKKAVLDSILAIAPEKQSVLNQLMNLGEMAQKTSDVIEGKAAGIFAKEVEPHINNPFIGSKTEVPEEPKMHRLGTMVMDHSADPEKLIEQLNNSIGAISSAAPEISSALSTNVTQAVTFLASKIPASQKEGLLDSEPKLTNGAIQQFNRYAQVVEKPIDVLNSVKNGTLIPQDIETLNAVYPGLYEVMRNQVMDKLISKVGKQKSLLLPYNKRMSLSFFLGMPLDSTLKPRSIMSNQQAFGTMQIQRQMNAQSQMTARASKTGMGKMDPLRDLTRSQRALVRR